MSLVLIPYGKKPKTLPAVLSPEEVRADSSKPFLSRCDLLLLQTAYSLRLAHLRSWCICKSVTSTASAWF